MQKVLLAVDGIKPTDKAFRYAVELCQRLRAELRILQVIRPNHYGQYLKRIQRSVRFAKRYAEDSMVAITFAEAGEHETAREIMAQARKNMSKLMPESEQAGIPCHLTMTSGRPGREIVRYVNKHRDVVLTIYDTAREENSECGILAEEGEDRPDEIGQRMCVPLVMFKDKRIIGGFRKWDDSLQDY
jgi:nucleotide-binding universal stress UspA family protein